MQQLLADTQIYDEQFREEVIKPSGFDPIERVDSWDDFFFDRTSRVDVRILRWLIISSTRGGISPDDTG